MYTNWSKNGHNLSEANPNTVECRFNDCKYNEKCRFSEQTPADHSITAMK